MLLKKTLLLCLGGILCLFLFNACSSKEQKDKRHAKESFQAIAECINTKNTLGLENLFNSIGSSSLNENDIKVLFASFPSGITLNETSADDYVAVTDWVEGDSYGKNICWAREIIDNETGEKFGISVLECTSDGANEDLGIIRLIIYPVEDEENFDSWWNNLEEIERPNGLIFYDN